MHEINNDVGDIYPKNIVKYDDEHFILTIGNELALFNL
jgi:hypothetical protein